MKPLRRILPALLLAAAPLPSAGAADRLLAVTTDFQSAGSLSVLEMAPPWGAQNDLVPVHSDATARHHEGLIYVVNKLGADNVQVIDPQNGFETLIQFSVGSGMNPQDIAVVSPSRAYVSRYETNDLLEVNPQTGEHLGAVSLAAFADDDGLCEMHRMHIQGRYLYVQVQRMLRQSWPDPWIPQPPSYLAVVDLETRELVDVDPQEPGTQGIALAGTNPIAPMSVDPATGDLLVPEAGQYAVIDDGGIERVDLDSWSSGGFMITEAELGGDLTDFSLWSASKGYAVVSDPDFDTIFLSFDPSAGERLETVYAPGGYVLGDVLAYQGGYIFLADRDYDTPGVRIYDASTDDPVAGPIDTGLPPFELVFLPDPQSGVLTPPALDLVGLPYPDPSPGEVRLRWLDRSSRPLRLEVFDLRGRRLHAQQLSVPAGNAEILWDGRDAAGSRVAAGVYALRILSDSGRTAARTVRIAR